MEICTSSKWHATTTGIATTGNIPKGLALDTLRLFRVNGQDRGYKY